MTANHSSNSPLHISIGIPASCTDHHSTLAQKTIAIGRIARAAAIFRVDEILVYPDYSARKQNRQRRLITKILEYIETPQYLRKDLFTKSPELRFVGLLPPLRTPHHPLEKKIRDLKDGEIREGYAFKKAGKIVVNVGVEKLLPLIEPSSIEVPCRLTVQIEKKKDRPIVVHPTGSPFPSTYWGFKVEDTQKTLGKVLTQPPRYDLIVATSRTGDFIEKVWNPLRTQWKKTKRVLLLFGTHNEGLNEIFKREGLLLSDLVTYSINVISHQGVATVRTEEAVFISLAMLRLLELKE